MTKLSVNINKMATLYRPPSMPTAASPLPSLPIAVTPATAYTFLPIIPLYVPVS